MFVQYLLSVIASLFVATTSVRISRDFREIEVGYGELIPIWADVLEGNSVKAACGSLQPVTWTYFGNNEPLPGTNRQHNNTIILTNLRVSDSGYYYCIGTYRTQSGMIAYFKKSFVLYVWTKPPLGFVLPNEVHVSEGENVTFACGSFREVEWFFRPIGQEVHLANNTLLLKNVRKDSSGLYLCRGFRINRRVFQIPAALFVDTHVVFTANITIESEDK